MFQTSGILVLMASISTYLALSTTDLFQNAVIPGPNSVIGDFTVATYTGYAQQVNTTVSAPFLDPVNGGVSIACPSHLFLTTGPVLVTNTIYGWFMRDAGGNLIAAAAFPPSGGYPMQVVGNAIPLEIILNFQDLGTPVSLVG